MIKLNSLEKTYHSSEIPVRAVRPLTLEIKAGEFVSIMGTSGSGKSTLMNILGCLDSPTSGEYFLDGKNVAHLSRDELATIRHEKIGFIFQNFNLLARTTALENVELPLMYGRKTCRSRTMKEKALQALDIVGLSDRAQHHPNQLSGGQQQRVAIARALVTNAPILLADEPTGNLDTRTSLEIIDIFQKLNQQGITIIIVTHEPDIAQFTHRQISMKDGAVVSDMANPCPPNAHAELEKIRAQQNPGLLEVVPA